MLKRMTGLAIALMCAGCANDPNPGLSDASISYLGGPVPSASLSEPLAAQADIDASKVLAAIAFQRVTGRDIDPARLVGKD
jgi:hypothetical protein